MRKLIELWQELIMWHDEMQWKHSKERRELARERLEQLRAFTSGESDINPYADLYVETTNIH